MRLVRLLRDFLLVHRRAVAGMCILITAAVLLAFFFRPMEGFYRDLSRLQERDAPFFYVTFSALLILAFLTSIFPASLFGVLGGMLFGLVKGFALCSGALLAAALIAFAFARYFFRIASRQLAAKVLDLDRLEARLGKHGWRYALMIRASPIAPFGNGARPAGTGGTGSGGVLMRSAQRVAAATASTARHGSSNNPTPAAS